MAIEVLVCCWANNFYRKFLQDNIVLLLQVFHLSLLEGKKKACSLLEGKKNEFLNKSDI